MESKFHAVFCESRLRCFRICLFGQKKVVFQDERRQKKKSGVVTDVWRNKKCQNIAVFRLFHNPTRDLRQYLLETFFTQVKFPTGLAKRTSTGLFFHSIQV
jgi:hypothetical protein